MNRAHKHRLILFVLILMVLAMAACGRRDEAATVAEKFLRAAVANDLADLQETVDPDYQDQVMMSIFLQMGLSAFVGGAQGEYTELKVTTITNDGQRATVHATGKLKVVMLGTQMIVPVDVQIPLVKKQGRWYVTVAESGQLGPSPTPIRVMQATPMAESSTAGVWQYGGVLLSLDFTSTEAAQAGQARIAKKAKELGLAASWVSGNSLFLLLPPMEASTLDELVISNVGATVTTSLLEAVGPAIVSDIDQGSLVSTGGLMTILQAKLPAGYAPSDDTMDAAIQIITHRLRDLVGKGYCIQRLGWDRVLVLLPVMHDPELVLRAVSSTGLLELVDADNTALMPGQIVTTTLGTMATPASGVYPTIITGRYIREVRAESDPLTGAPLVLYLTPRGAKILADHTSENIGKFLAIVFDKEVICTPRIQSQVPNGEVPVAGQFTSEEAETLAIVLRYGALPVPLTIVETRPLGPIMMFDFPAK